MFALHRGDLLCNSVVVKEKTSASKLKEGGYGARELLPLDSVSEQVESTGPLLLLDEEAMYLLALSQLEIFDEPASADGESSATSMQAMWAIFCAKSRNFPSKYVVRTGINFGVDYCVYHALPSQCHSEMCVTVVDAWGQGNRVHEAQVQGTDSTTSPDAACSARSGKVNTAPARMDELSWRHVTTLTRVIPDVMKLCIICYVLPAHWDQDHAKADTALPTDTHGSSAEPTAPAISPYLSTLFFPGRQPPTLSQVSLLSGSSSDRIDARSPACLQRLAVRPVTALVRRLPALSSSYQTVAQIQTQYQSASTAQKKKDLKLAQKRSGGGGSGGGGGGGGTSAHKDKDKDKDKDRQRGQPRPVQQRPTDGSTSTGGGDDANAHLRSVDAESGPAGATNPVSAGIPTSALASDKPLSGRQKRIEKYLLKQQLRQSQEQQSQSQPRSKQLKARRDHREIRSKVMSNKNQSLLDVMQGSGSRSGNANTGAGAILGTSARADDGTGGGAMVETPLIETVRSSSDGYVNGSLPAQDAAVQRDEAGSGSITASKRSYEGAFAATAPAEPIIAEGDHGHLGEAASDGERVPKRPRNASEDATIPQTWFQRFCVIS